MRLSRGSQYLQNPSESDCQEPKTPRSGILDTYLDHFVNENSLNFNNLALCTYSNAVFYIFEALYWIPYAVFALIILTVTIPVLSNYCSGMARCNTLSADRRAIFFTFFEDRIRREFHSQSAETMSTIVTAVSHILRPSPERPSILLFLASSDAKDTSAKISRATASAVMSSFKNPNCDVDKVTLNCSNYTSSEQFWTFYEDMSERMRREKVVVLTEFEKINARVATALCHLADDTYAPFPQSIVIACMDIGNRFDPNYLKRHAPVTLAEAFLEEKWNCSLDNVSVTEIFGRITGRALLIDSEATPRRSTGSLPSSKGYSGPPPRFRRRRKIARSEMQI